MIWLRPSRRHSIFSQVVRTSERYNEPLTGNTIMHLLENLPLEDITPSRLWPELDAESRTLAARTVLDPASGDPSARAEAHAAIVSALRFRPAAVQRLPSSKRVEYLLRAVRPDDSLATSLLLALHLSHRTDMLSTFLEALEIPQKDGLIEPDYELVPIEPDRLGPAVSRIREGFPEDHVAVYLASLIALDSDVWGGLVEIVQQQGTDGRA